MLEIRPKHDYCVHKVYPINRVPLTRKGADPDKIIWMDEHSQADTPAAEELRANQEQLRSRLNALKIAYLNNAEFEGRRVSYEDLKRTAKELIQVNYELQRLLYGSIKLKLSVAKLLRHGG